MGASRFPGKPLAKILGMPMIEHVYKRSMLAKSIDEVFVAACDEEVRQAVEAFGGKVFMTDKEIIRERVIIEARTIVQIWNDIVEDKKNLSLEPEEEEEGIDAFQAIINKRNKELNINDYLRLFSGHTDYLINIKLKGIVSLLNKSDCEGYYSVGDSYDIVLMLDIISKRTDIDPQFMEIINCLKKVFKTSVNKKKNVTIC